MIDIKIYNKLDQIFKEQTSLDTGFNALISPTSAHLDQKLLEGFKSRYHTIKRFQEISLDIFQRSLEGELDPDIANIVFNELPDYLKKPYHSILSPAHFTTPVFFRTDEGKPGKILEIQCPGSLWGEYALLETLYSTVVKCTTGNTPLQDIFSNTLHKYLKKTPIIHHLLDNASLPHSLFYFIQMTRPKLKYWSFDKGIKPMQCNFIRSHSFRGLVAQDFHSLRLSQCNEGELFFDHPPICLFDQKISLIFPFWDKTYQYFDDDIRDIFPFTQLITPNGFYLEDGSWISLENFCSLPRKSRDYFIKYAGTDSLINWGSRAVFYAGMLSKTACNDLMKRIITGFSKNQFWIIQPSINSEEDVEFIERSGDLVKTSAHVKYSGFYGPTGFLGTMIMHRQFRKVHGSDSTIINICSF